jgi:hypothetical protein
MLLQNALFLLETSSYSPGWALGRLGLFGLGKKSLLGYGPLFKKQPYSDLD